MRLKRTFIFILLFSLNCAIQPTVDKKVVKTIRVGIVTDISRTEFQAGDDFDVYTYDGTLLMTGQTGDQCTIQVISGTAATMVYRLVAKSTPDEREAAGYAAELQSKGLPVAIKTTRQRMLYKGEIGDYNMSHVCINKEFKEQNAAEEYRRTISSLVYTKISPFMLDYPKGTVQLTNLRNNEKVESSYYLRIVGNVIVIESKSGQGFHFENEGKRTYHGDINYVIDRNGKITIINEISMDDYLCSVVSAEMNPKFPLQALKAQAVTARSYTLSHLGKQHPLDPFDVCDDVHCQVFAGSSRITADVVTAVRETEGEVLTNDGEICETFYCGVCGGHTEHNENVWQGTPRRYLRGVFDLPSNNVQVSENYLIEEDHVEKWVSNEPRVYCNLNLIECPPYLEYTKKYFRWTVEYSQSEIKRIVEKKTGKSLGQISDIIPLERGISGRLNKIRINGTKQNLIVDKELEIRRVLSDSYLYSSCFIVEKEAISNNIPQKFKIIGAGWGHGVGMCQTGAAVMAIRGASYNTILAHYYRESKLTRMY
ncbi:SpoIID/LytB domain-containing protein [candidate division KSB1 bacterium]|nr:SpoIID/LytB domain-containing protein [candidate division KSB1 bacterium]